MALLKPPISPTASLFDDPYTMPSSKPSVDARTARNVATLAPRVPGQTSGGQLLDCQACLPAPSSYPSTTLLLPSTFLSYNSIRKVNQGVPAEVAAFLNSDLDLSRLNQIHKHLWFAGLERPARPLHRHVALGRAVRVTEQTDLHLVWAGSTIYVKPLPDYLLCHSFWKEHISPEPALHESACGLLLSYLWLIRYPLDLMYAKQLGLLNSTISWDKWHAISQEVLQNIDYAGLSGINIRYRHGELRMHRINTVFRLCSKTRTLSNLIRGFRFGYSEYSSFLRDNLAWLVTIAVIMALVLTAMQVGLATDALSDKIAFQRASVGFTVFSMLGPLAIAVLVLIQVLFLVYFNMAYAVSRKKDWTGAVAINKWDH